MVGGKNSLNSATVIFPNYAPNRESSRSKRPPPNLLQKLYLRETTERQHRSALFNKLPGRLAFKLSNLVSESVLHSGHVFLGFTKDSQFILSYTMQLEAELPAAFPAYRYSYKLHWWRFVPYKPLKKVSEVLLFGEQDTPEDLYIIVCQWPSDESKILVYGFCTSDSSDQQLRQCFVTITAIPTLGSCSDCDQLQDIAEGSSDGSFHCLKHGFTIHSKYHLVPPFPKCSPKTSLQIDGTVVINTGDSLLALTIRVNEGSKPTNGETRPTSENTTTSGHQSEYVTSSVDSPPSPSKDDPCFTDLAESPSQCVSAQFQSPNSGILDAGRKMDNPNNGRLYDFVDCELETSELCSNHHHEQPAKVVLRNCKNDSSSLKSCFYDYDSTVKNSSALGVDPPSVTSSASQDQTSHVRVVSRSALSPSHRSVPLHHKRSCTSPDAPLLKRISADRDQSVERAAEEHFQACDVKQLRLHSGHAQIFVDQPSVTKPDVTLDSKERFCGEAKPQTPDWFPAEMVSPNSSEVCRTNNSGDAAETSTSFAKPDVGSGEFLESIPQSVFYSHKAIDDSNNDPCVFLDVPANHSTALRTSCDESAKENISPYIRHTRDTLLDVEEAKMKDHPRVVDLANKKASDCQLPSADAGSNCSSVTTSVHPCVVSVERIFVEKHDHRGVFDEEDDSSSLPLEVHGTANLQMMCISSDGSEKIVGQSITVKQQTFDVEQFVHEMAQQLCSDAGKRYLSVNDYDIQLIDVVPETGEAIVLAMMLIKAAAVKTSGQTKTVRHLNNICKKIYEATFTFVWNVNTGFYSILEVEDLVEKELHWKDRQVHVWNPGNVLCQQMQKSCFIPQSPMKTVSVLSNAAYMKGASLDIIFEPSQHFALVL